MYFSDTRFYLSKTATCFDIYIGHPQAHTIPESHIEEGNGLVLCLIKITYSKNTDNI